MGSQARRNHSISPSDGVLARCWMGFHLGHYCERCAEIARRVSAKDSKAIITIELDFCVQQMPSIFGLDFEEATGSAHVGLHAPVDWIHAKNSLLESAYFKPFLCHGREKVPVLC